jgi:hypothetical protein
MRTPVTLDRTRQQADEGHLGDLVASMFILGIIGGMVAAVVVASPPAILLGTATGVVGGLWLGYE